MTMRRPITPIVLALAVVAGGCGLLHVATRPPRAPEAEARQVRFPAAIPAERTVIDGRALRAAVLALDDFLPEPTAPLPDDADPLSRCLARRDSYDVLVWSGGGTSLPDVGAGVIDAGVADAPARVEPNDAGTGNLPGTDVLYVTIFLRAGACPEGDSPVLDAGGTYAIDTANWRILAIKH